MSDIDHQMRQLSAALTQTADALQQQRKDLADRETKLAEAEKKLAKDKVVLPLRDKCVALRGTHCLYFNQKKMKGVLEVFHLLPTYPHLIHNSN